MSAPADAAGLPMTSPLWMLNGSPNIFRDRYGTLTDEDWRDLLVRSIDEAEIDGVVFPRFPAADVQEGMHGHSGRVSLYEAQLFYSFIKTRPPVRELIGGDAAFLDFGSGWGRIARMFLRDFALKRLYGFEPNPAYCAMARSLNPYIGFFNGDYTPDNSLPPNRFDLVVGWSVFSHLSERSAGDWLEEMARIIRPRGCCVFTTWGQRFVDYLIGEQEKILAGRPEEVHWYHRECLEGAGDIRKQRERYLDGKYVWFTTIESDLYGNTVIHPNALVNLLRSRRLPFELVEFDQTSLAQDAFTLRRIDRRAR